MTHRDVALGREIVARWCNLAERRLEYLTELFETGRWRRFHSEVQFLQNIQEAKAAVETCRDLLPLEKQPAVMARIGELIAEFERIVNGIRLLGERPHAKSMLAAPYPRITRGLRGNHLRITPRWRGRA